MSNPFDQGSDWGNLSLDSDITKWHELADDLSAKWDTALGVLVLRICRDDIVTFDTIEINMIGKFLNLVAHKLSTLEATTSPD